MAKMGRPQEVPLPIIVSIRISRDDYNLVKDIAALESTVLDRPITTHELIRGAIQFVYRDNERMRECFRRSRGPRNTYEKRC